METSLQFRHIVCVCTIVCVLYIIKALLLSLQNQEALTLALCPLACLPLPEVSTPSQHLSLPIASSMMPVPEFASPTPPDAVTHGTNATRVEGQA